MKNLKLIELIEKNWDKIEKFPFFEKVKKEFLILFQNLNSMDISLEFF
jgi:hypothetical protein